MASQSKFTIALGAGNLGVAQETRWRVAAQELGYWESDRNTGISEMVREMANWIIENGEWEKGRGLVGIKNIKS